MVSGRKERWLAGSSIGVPQKSFDLRGAGARRRCGGCGGRVGGCSPQGAKTPRALNVRVVDDGEWVVVQPVAVQAVEVRCDGYGGSERVGGEVAAAAARQPHATTESIERSASSARPRDD